MTEGYYKKKYEDALLRAKAVLKVADNDESFNYVSTIFPELAESKDEKIRKALIERIREIDNEEFINGSGFYAGDYDAYEICDWLERQCKQEEPQVYETENGEVITYSETDGYNVVKPKFKVGDWLQYRNAKPFFVEEITKQGYVNGDSCLPFNWENEIHLWTIQDAKPGDVLAGKIDGDNYILIFKTIKDGWIETYGHYYNAVNRFCVPSQLFCRSYQGTFAPATKEQHDLLFQKMKEAGYEWDAEKKELKKIEEDDLTEFENALTDVCRGWTGEEHGWKDYIIKNSFPLLALAKKQFDEYEKKPVKWSNKDEKMLHTIIADFKGFKHDNTSTLESHFNECIDWLKSLKDRVQPKQKWSDEDFKRIDYICDFIWKNRKGDTDEIYQQEQDVKWLKSLKDKVHPQSKE